MIKRQLLDDLKKHLEKKEITLLTGPRQSGKTTILMLLREGLEKQGGRAVYFNLDVESDRAFFVSQEGLLRKIVLEIGREKGFVFIDEIQRKEDAGLFLKGLYDMNLPYKFIVSGSGSVELKEKIHESLAGRKRVFELSTLNFAEFVNYKTDYRYETNLPEFFRVEHAKALNLLNEYLDFGGYPRVVLEERVEEKRRVIAELYQSYLERDITLLLNVAKTDKFNNLVRLMAGQIGSLVNISELSQTLGVSVATVNNYLWYMQKTFLLQRVAPFYRNIRKEITKAPVFYFYDLGLRNFALGTFGQDFKHDRGFIFQNFVYNLLKQRIAESGARVHFWRTTDKAEVDFVVDAGSSIIPLEVKYREANEPKVSRSFASFISSYKPTAAFFVSLGEKGERAVGGTKVSFIPFYELLTLRIP